MGWVSLHFSPDSRDASSGDWDTESCQTLETQATHTRCQCQHLSTFAVLAQPPKDLVSGREVPGLGGRGAGCVLPPGLPGAIRGGVGGDLVIPHVRLSGCTWGAAHTSPCPREGAHRDDVCLETCGGGAIACIYTHMRLWLCVVKCG